MKRLQRKLLLISAVAHGILLLVVLVGPAFMRRPGPRSEDLPVLRVIPEHLIDAAFHQSASPAQEPAEPAEPAPSQVVPREPQPIPTPAKPPVTRTPPPVQPVRSDPVPTPQPRVDPAPRTQEPPPATPPPPARAPVSVSKSLVTRGERPPARPREDTARTERAQQQAARAVESQVKDALSGIRRQSSDAVVSVPGAGGAAYANYRQVVQTVYDQAWLEPQDVSRTDLAVLVEVVIRKDGKVLSDAIVRTSGLSSLDRSVQAALDRVRVGGLPPFPQETRDMQRTFRIEFNLRSRRLSG
jgi:TonB family protein